METTGDIRGNNELGNPFARLDCLRFAGVVVQSYHNFTAVVGVDDANLICRRQTFFTCQTTSCIDKTGIADRNLDSQTGMDKHRCTAGNRDCFVHAGIQIRACREFRTVRWKNRTLVKFLNINIKYRIFVIGNHEKNRPFSSHKTTSFAASDFGTSIILWFVEPRNRKSSTFWSSINSPSTMTSI